MIDATTINLAEVHSVTFNGCKAGDVVYAVSGSRRLIVGRIVALDISVTAKRAAASCVLELVDTDSGERYQSRFAVDTVYTDVDDALAAMRVDVLEEQAAYFDVAPADVGGVDEK